MDKMYTVTQALQYLNAQFGEHSPQNEETLRRAIRSGRLKAEVRRGKEGSLIQEEDLMAYGRGYALKRQIGKIDLRELTAAKEGGGENESAHSPQHFLEVVKASQETDMGLTDYKLRLLEAKKAWKTREGQLKLQLQKLESQLEECHQEVELFEKELEEEEFYKK